MPRDELRPALAHVAATAAPGDIAFRFIELAKDNSTPPAMQLSDTPRVSELSPLVGA
jgi:hypothetical protein